jgi:ABC-type multidrug transport system ATPase subunit
MTSATNTPMISIQNVTKRYGAFTALDHLSFDAPAGRALALWGPNGAGKTTLIKCLLGLIPFEGSIRVNGFDVQRQGRQARAAIGYVPQELAFYPELTTLETAHFFARLKKADTRQIAPALELVGILPHADKLVHNLSGGTKQRLALALALLGDPPILVLDEPSANLDVGARDHFLSMLAQLKAAGKTILFTSHRIEEIEALADDALALEQGCARLHCPGRDLAAHLKLRTQIKLFLPGDLLDSALTILQTDGFSAHRNGTGILVQTPHDAKAQPIHALNRAGIVVSNFEME